MGKWDEARSEYDKALEIRQNLIKKHPEVPVYRVELAGTYRNIGFLFGRMGKSAESLEPFTTAIATLAEVKNKEPGNGIARRFLRDSYSNRAYALDILHRHAEAVKDWEQAVALSPETEKLPQRAQYAASRMLAGQVTEAVADVVELTKHNDWHYRHWYDFACIYAIASGKIAAKKEEYANRAMELLEKAVKAGFKNAAHMAKDSDLDSLREREDFKKLMAEIAAAAKTPKKP
jgi:tetratricopeptide (TPR) repeat protein